MSRDMSRSSGSARLAWDSASKYSTMYRAASIPSWVVSATPSSRWSMVSTQIRICWRSPAGTPSIDEMTSTGNRAANSATMSN